MLFIKQLKLRNKKQFTIDMENKMSCETEKVYDT